MKDEDDIEKVRRKIQSITGLTMLVEGGVLISDEMERLKRLINCDGNFKDFRIVEQYLALMN